MIIFALILVDKSNCYPATLSSVPGHNIKLSIPTDGRNYQGKSNFCVFVIVDFYVLDKDSLYCCLLFIKMRLHLLVVALVGE